jgi:hypothetical protein
MSEFRIHLVRRWKSPRSTISELLVPGISVPLFALEDPVREGPKVAGDTAIPTGDYRMTLYFSPRFKKQVLLFHDVPGFDYIEIHPGNYPTDTRGCILPGMARGEDEVRGSQIAFALVMARCQWEAGLDRELWITVEDAAA